MCKKQGFPLPFSGTLLLSMFFGTFFGCTTAPKKLAVIQGATDQRTTQIAVLMPKNQTADFLLVEKKQLRLHSPVRTRTIAMDHSPWRVVQISFKGLSNEEQYALKITETLDGEELLLDQRDLKTLPTRGRIVRFALASCMDDSYSIEQTEMWNQVQTLQPDLVLMIGDNVYADRGLEPLKPATPNTVWDRFVQTRNALDIFKFKRLTPILATWDDHDYGANNSDRTYPYKRNSLKTFSGFFPQAALSSSIRKGPGVSFVYKAFGHRFVFLDNRFFRSPSTEANGTHWGDRQEKWLFSILKGKAMPSYLIQGDRFLGKYPHWESLEFHHPQAFARLRNALISSPSPVVLVSGDRHQSELTRIPKDRFGYETLEITSSPIHAKTFPGNWDDFPNPDRFALYEKGPSFILVQSSALRKKMRLQISAYSREGLVFEHSVEVKR